MNYTTFLILPTIFFISCSSKDSNSSEKEHTSTQEINTVPTKILTEEVFNGIKISHIQIDTNKTINEIKGLVISFDVDIKNEALESIRKDGYGGYFMDLTCTTPQGKSIIHRNELFKKSEKKKFIHSNRECFISSQCSRTIEIALPYRFLEMKKGNQELTITIDAFPIKYADDSTSLNMKLMRSISESPKASTSLTCNINAPQLYKTKVSVLKAKLDKKSKNPAKYDIALTGTGYPDLFWEVFCGNDYIYYSPVEKNKTEYQKKCTSPSFYCTKEDVINLGMIDYDNGPFNTQDDIIGIYKLKTSDLNTHQTDTLHFGKLEYMIVETKVEEVE